MLRWHILCWQLLWKSILLKLVDIRGCKTKTITTITTTTNDFVVRTQEEEILGFIVYVRFQQQALRGEKRKKSLQLCLWNLKIGIEKNRFEMLNGGYDISNDVITLGSCFSIFVYIRARFASRWLEEIWQLSRRGAPGVLEVEFKFQRRSCKLSFLFPPLRQIAAESLLAG